MQLRPPTAAEEKTLKFWQKSTFLVFLFGYICYYLLRKNQTFANIFLIQEFPDISLTDLALIGTYGEISYAFGKMIFGPAADKFGGKRIFFMGMLAAILMNITFTMGSSLWAFVIIWSICRFFLSAGWGGLTKVIGAWYSTANIGKSMGVISTSFMFGSAIAGLVSGGIATWIEQGSDPFGTGALTWRALFILPAILVGGYGIVTWFLSKNDPRDVFSDVKFGNHGEHTHINTTASHLSSDSTEATETATDIMAGLLKIPFFRAILLFSILTTVVRISLFYWIPMILFLMGLTASTSILSSILFPFFGALGTIFIGWYTDRYSVNGDRARMTFYMLVPLCAIMLLIPAVSPSQASLPYSKIKTEIDAQKKAKAQLAAEEAAENGTQVADKGQLSIWEELGENPELTAVVLFFGLAGLFLYGPYSMSSGAFTIDCVGPKYAGTATGMIDFVGYIAASVLSNIAIASIAEKFSLNAVFYMLFILSVFSALVAWMMSIRIRRGTW